LKKFLLQYPALFQVEGNHVTINCFQNPVSDVSAAGKKDYIQEAKDYFSQKLLQYGAGTEVPIKSLLGHRSQASPQVRHISGQHIKEFTDFLSKHPDTFRVTDEHIVLVNFEAAMNNAQSEYLHLPQPSIDVKFTQEILDSLAHYIEVQGPTLVDQLFHYIMSQFPQERWFRIFKTSNDLTTFLKLFSDCFHIQSNLVTLLQMPKISENHIHNAEKVLSKNSINSTTTPTVGEFKLNGPVSNGGMLVSNGHNNNNKSNNKSGNYNDDSLSNGRNSATEMPSMGFNPSSLHEIRLDNLCANNCPKKITYDQPQHNETTSEKSPMASQQPQQQTTQQQTRERGGGRINLTLKQRINSLVTKTLAENEEKDRRAPPAIQPVNGGGSVSSSNSSSTAASPIHSRNNYFQGDTWKIKMLHNTRVIASVKESQFVVDAIRKPPPASDESVVISFDSEVVNVGAKGVLTLMQVGTIRGEAFIFDLQQCPEMVVDGGLKSLLEDENVIKIIHDCRNDSFNLHSQYNILLRNVFDTQVNDTSIHFHSFIYI
jgi:exonuclease 3'-5' domain-containing protein 1